MKAMTYEVYPETRRKWWGALQGVKSQQWRWRAIAGNGEIVATGEAYTRKRDVIRAIDAFREQAADGVIVVRGGA